MPAANDLKKGQVISFNGEPHLIMETQHRTPGNLRAFVQVKMRNLRYGKSLEQRFNSPDHVDVLPTDRRTLEFSYADRDTYYGDPKFNQIPEETLLSKSYAAERRKQIGPNASLDFEPGVINGKKGKHPSELDAMSARIDDELMARDTTCVDAIDKD